MLLRLFDRLTVDYVIGLCVALGQKCRRTNLASLNEKSDTQVAPVSNIMNIGL